MRLDDLLADFLRSLKRRELSPNTIEAYQWALHDLIGKGTAGWRPEQRVLANLDREALEAWQDSLLERSLAPRSRSLAVTAARQFLRFLMDKDYIDSRLERSLARVKIPEGTPHPISKPDLDKLKTYFLVSPNLLERALFFCLLVTGARISEALRMKADDYHSPMVIQKGGSTKRLRMTPSLIATLEEYTNKGIFSGNRFWGDLTPSDARLIWKRVTAELGIPYFTSHALRHTCATLLLEAGFSELAIAEWLGHHGTATVHNYAKVLDAQRQNMLDAMEELMKIA